MADNRKCMCGKILTEDDVCPLPSGEPCNGQRFTPTDAMLKQQTPEPEQSSLEGLEDIL